MKDLFVTHALHLLAVCEPLRRGSAVTSHSKYPGLLWIATHSNKESTRLYSIRIGLLQVSRAIQSCNQTCNIQIVTRVCRSWRGQSRQKKRGWLYSRRRCLIKKTAALKESVQWGVQVVKGGENIKWGQKPLRTICRVSCQFSFPLCESRAVRFSCSESCIGEGGRVWVEPHGHSLQGNEVSAKKLTTLVLGSNYEETNTSFPLIRRTAHTVDKALYLSWQPCDCASTYSSQLYKLRFHLPSSIRQSVRHYFLKKI